MPGRAQFAWLFLRFGGRIDRTVYFLANLLIGVIQLFPVWKATMEIVRLGPETLMDASLEELLQMSPGFEHWWSIAGLLTFVMLWPYLALSTKRLHDIGWSGVFSIALLIPIVQIVAFVALCLIPGTSGPNRYGQRANAPMRS